MSIEERIEAMVRSGALTEEQASKFRSSVSQSPPEKKIFSKQKRLPVGILLGAFLITSVALIFMSGSGGEQGGEVVQNVAESMNQQGVNGVMNKSFQNTLSVIVILLPVLLCVFFVMYLYNSLINKEEEVFLSWSQVESQYQRRADLIPNLVSTVQGYAEQEKDVLIGVTAERARVTQALTALQESEKEAEALRKDASNHLEDEAFMAQLASAQQRFSKNITGVFALVENYPELESSDNFMALQDQIEGTENRINIARMVFNDAVNDFNKLTRVMPSSLIASAGDFNRKAYFEAGQGAKESPKVSFD
ncbi:LemA family protein [Methylophaga sp.]|uniref:LemA family protein n=1 Tax=Methylophaga sp. TaxID=2024840 RepID=UPI003F69C7E5